MLDSDIAVLRPAERSESLPKRSDARHYFRIVLGVWMQERDATHALARLRPLEAGLGWLPLGAQYVAFARKA